MAHIMLINCVNQLIKTIFDFMPGEVSDYSQGCPCPTPPIILYLLDKEILWQNDQDYRGQPLF
jgi:hypothetical protein